MLTEAIKHIESAWHKVGKVSGVPTGLTGLDQKLGGLQPSDLVILAGRPSMGKTALAVTIAANAAAAQNVSADAGQGARTRNYVVGVFSLEMSAEQLATRLLSGKGRIESDRLRRGDIGEEDWPAGGARQPGAGRAAAVHRRHAGPLDRGPAHPRAPAQAHAGPATCWWSTTCSCCAAPASRARPTGCRRSPRSPRA